MGRVGLLDQAITPLEILRDIVLVVRLELVVERRAVSAGEILDQFGTLAAAGGDGPDPGRGIGGVRE